MKRTFQASIINGRIDKVGGAQIAKYITARKDGQVALTVATGVDIEERLRSNNQNRYYWGVAVKTYLEAMIETGDTMIEDVRRKLRTPTLIDAMHELLKYEFAGCEVIDTNSGEIRQLPMSTTQMTTVEMGVYWDKIRAACLDRYGVDIPPPPDDLFAD